MSERERLGNVIYGLVNEDCPLLISEALTIADFIISDRARIIAPLVKNYKQIYISDIDELIALRNDSNETLRNAGVEL